MSVSYISSKRKAATFSAFEIPLLDLADLLKTNQIKNIFIILIFVKLDFISVFDK